MNSGVIPFDGLGLTTIYLKCNITLSNLSTSAQNYMLSAYKAVNGVTAGFGIYFNTSSNHYLYAFFGDGNGTNTWLNLDNGSSTGSSSNSMSYTPQDGTYEVTITQESISSWSFKILLNSEQIYSDSINVILSNSDLEVMVGQRRNPNTGNFAGFCPMEILDFYISKTI